VGEGPLFAHAGQREERACLFSMEEKISFRLQPERRIKKADDFSSVFCFLLTHKSKHFKLNVKLNELAYSRLGLIVPKKICPKAVQRNKTKRIIREFFRRKAGDLSGMDIIIRLRSPYPTKEASSLFCELEKIFSEVKKCRIY
jgi:ribonuclease P protein component